MPKLFDAGGLVQPPQDRIEITINNLTGAYNINCSRELPGPYVVSVLCKLSARLMDDVMMKLAGQIPQPLPPIDRSS